MDPFESLKILRQAFIDNTAMHNEEDTMTYKEYKDTVLHMLDVLEHDLGDASYSYVMENINADEIFDIDGYTVTQKQLADGLVVIQPALSDPGDMVMINMESLCDTIVAMKESGRIKEDIIIAPPFVNMFRAKLAKE